MANAIPFAMSGKAVERLLEHVQKAGVPSTPVNLAYLKTAGFKSGNDTYLPPLLKALGFIDATAAPTARWTAYRNTGTARRTLGEGVREAYAGLFQMYPDADRKDDEAIRNWVRGREPKFDEGKVASVVATFKALCRLSDFDAGGQAGTPTPVSPVKSTVASPVNKEETNTPVHLVTSAYPAVNINISLQLPPSIDGVTYDKFFASMKKHLFPDGS